MENSSSINNTIIDGGDDKAAENPAEESGWTAYLEDFSCYNAGGSFVSSPSLISDAAWNGSEGVIRRLNFNNLRNNNNNNNNNRKYSCDDDLEDTASSPVNSPKVSSMKQMEVNYMKSTDDIAVSGNFLGKQAISNNFWKQDAGEEKRVIEGKNVDKLRKRGLCLVPMSTLINYIG